jgi:hypothetical protein
LPLANAGLAGSTGKRTASEGDTEERVVTMPRVIYSLLFELEPEKPGITLSLVVPLNAEGQPTNGLTKAVLPKRRVIELRVGDGLTFKRRAYKIAGVAAYRDAQWTDGTRASGDGYEVGTG